MKSDLPPPGTHKGSQPRPLPGVVLSIRHGMTPEFYCLTTTFSRKLNDERKTSDNIDLNLEKQQGESKSYPAISPFVSAPKAYIDLLEYAFSLPDQDREPSTRLLLRIAFSSYRKLFALVFLSNMSAAVALLFQLRKRGSSTATCGNAATAASANLCIGVLVRNEHIVNLLFRVACATPRWIPLFFRRRIAKVYCYGGLHSGCNVSGTLWYFIFVGLYIHDSGRDTRTHVVILLTTVLIVCCLVTILIFAHPHMRSKHHDLFEYTHRFLGWAVICCFWAQSTILARDKRSSSDRPWRLTLVQTPTFWFLAIITICILYPWSRLRRRRVQAERLSARALRLRFGYAHMDTCCGIRLTDTPLKETHGFATIPNLGGTKGFSILISAAGDWTSNIIQNPPTHIWVRGAPVIGVARIALMFRKVLMIATGTGIGPCLSLLQARPDCPTRVLWSARMPERTYDSETIKSVLRADPEAVLLDSQLTGRCNLLALAYSLYRESHSEAVIVISNPKVVKEIVLGLESRGIPAYGPVFDS